MEKINDGGQAFPVGLDVTGGQYAPEAGMTLRAYLAGQALQGILSQPWACSLDYADLNSDAALANADAIIAKLGVQS